MKSTSQADGVLVLRACLVAAIIVGLAGCQSPGPRRGLSPARTSGAGVDAIEIYASPVAVDWDGVPGSDGLSVRAMFFRFDRSQAVAVGDGELIFMLFAGRQAPAEVRNAQPLMSWRFDADQLRQVARQTIIGVSYNFHLPWEGERPPPAPTVSLTARYQPPSGPPVWTAPTTLSLVAR